MPNYDYQCKECGTVTEIFHKMSQDPEVLCPACESPMKRKISAGAGIMFKGSGYYVNDYKSSGGKAEAKAETETSSVPKQEVKTEPTTATKTEAAPAVKAESAETKKA